jgi:hypothetical protein
MFLKRITTGWPTWVCECYVETKMRPSQWAGKNTSRPKKARRVRPNVKVMLTVFYIEGVVQQGQTANCWNFLDVLKCPRENDLSCGETARGSSIMTIRQLGHRY